jgi:hypothetical protein
MAEPLRTYTHILPGIFASLAYLDVSSMENLLEGNFVPTCSGYYCDPPYGVGIFGGGDASQEVDILYRCTTCKPAVLEVACPPKGGVAYSYGRSLLATKVKTHWTLLTRRGADIAMEVLIPWKKSIA